LIRHLGLSGVTDAQLTEAQRIAPVVTVQNAYNLALRDDDELVDRCARDGIAFAPFFPLGGFTALQSDILDRVAARLAASPQQVALAWLLRRSPTMTVIPGTASVAHLRENVAAAGLVLPADALAELDTIGQAGQVNGCRLSRAERSRPDGRLGPAGPLRRRGAGASSTLAMSRAICRRACRWCPCSGPMSGEHRYQVKTVAAYVTRRANDRPDQDPAR
jgi:hypothetical protein